MRPGYEVDKTFIHNISKINIRFTSSNILGFACFLFKLFFTSKLCQNSTSNEGKIKYLVYCIEKAIKKMGSGQDQMVWLIDFQGYTKSKLSLKITKDVAHILQNCYPERLGLAILYNPPKVFEAFYPVCTLCFLQLCDVLFLRLAF